jgi:hypothetical protein
MRLYLDTLKKIEAEFGEFDVSQALGSNRMYLRFGYWDRIDLNKLEEILGSNIKVEEDSDYDDDCGYKFCYFLDNTF